MFDHENTRRELEAAHPIVDENDTRERHAYERSENRRARRRKLDLTCPTCKRPNALSPREAVRGYQCNRCADAEEGCF